jgi:GTP-binding protein
MEVTFVKSCADLTDRPAADLPEFVFLGRSNCGKSSLINYLLQRKGLAHTSGRPGKTQLLNYYLVAGRYHLVDLPGYGYARVSKERREQWWTLFRRLLAAQDRPLAVIHLVDVRHRPSDQDREVARWIRDSGHPFAVAVTKIDKVGRTERSGCYGRIIAELDLPATTPFVPTSAGKKLGRKELLGWIDDLLAAAEADGAAAR